MKIALIEDRIGRMNQFSEADILSFKEVTVITGKSLDELLMELNKSDATSLDSYACILAHRSALVTEQRDVIREYCIKQKKPLVLFSGGITSSIFNDGNVPFLLINSKDFYSNNFPLFVEYTKLHNEVNLLVLQFGAQWKLNLLLRLRDHVNYMIQRSSYRWIRDLQINGLLKDELIEKFALEWLKKPEISVVTESEVKEFYKKLNELIIDSL